MALDLINKARRGNHYTTWEFIYYCRKNNKTKAPSHDSEMILRWLIKYGHMPSCAVTNITPSAPVMPIKDIEAHDDGDIYISITLQKKGNIKDALSLLGENLSLYCQKNRDNANDQDLDVAVIDSKFQAISIGFDKYAKKTTDMQRVAGLWLFDRMKSSCLPMSISIAIQEFCDLFAKIEDELHKEHSKFIEQSQRTFERYYKQTELSIKQGQVLPMS